MEDKNAYEVTAKEDTYVEIVCASTKTLVVKQIMIDEAIKAIDMNGSKKPTAIDNAETSVKAVKRIVNGQLLIEKNGVLYTAQGAVVK